MEATCCLTGNKVQTWGPATMRGWTGWRAITVCRIWGVTTMHTHLLTIAGIIVTRNTNPNSTTPTRAIALAWGNLAYFDIHKYVDNTHIPIWL